MKGVRLSQKISYKFKENTPTILSFTGAIGVVLTAITAVKATPKAMLILEASKRDHEELSKADIIRLTFLAYIPTILIGTATIACIFEANILNKRQQAILANAYIILNNSYKEYRKKVHGISGAESDVAVLSSIAEDKHYDGEKCLFYEFNYGDFFERSREEVLNAEYRLNMLYSSRGYANLNDFYKLLGLPKNKTGKNLGWAFNDGLYGCPWIDIKHELFEMDDGLECYIIDFLYLPSVDYTLH